MPTIKDRSRLCAFTFADGRQCRTPRRSAHQHLCYYHAKKEAEALIAKQAGEDLASLFCGKVLCAPDFAAALGRVLSAVAGGYIKPKTAVSLALLGHTLNQSIKIAQHEYANAPAGKCPVRAGGLLCRAPCPSRAPFPGCSHAATAALRCARTQSSITTATRSAPGSQHQRRRSAFVGAQYIAPFFGKVPNVISLFHVCSC